ncbi:hypothetical protein MSAN_01302100 [Mycena sanguinolenta]|uniref:Uncharacterized protein n=1 Tax=Mycena sanguinolenta TaxID=230812 RepID=A0A8H6YFJ3_9AGAR|nr:hypothetical protein MSAN_01302100 [Mycena sanguinolenta]
MFRFRGSLASLTNYRLGYSPRRAYPWRWTTPLALFIVLTSTVLLTCLNIPLSAYEIVTEFTYFPNSTIPSLPMSNIIPSFLHAPSENFSPQTLQVGSTFRLNNSVFSYTIAAAFNGVDDSEPVSSFPYYNNRFSDSCDVTNITATFTRTLGDSLIPYQYYDYSTSGFVTCTRPTLFQMTWASPMTSDGLLAPRIDNFAQDVKVAFYSGALEWWGVDDAPYGDGTVEVTVRPCYNCTGTISTTSDATPQVEATSMLEPPCSTQPARFIGLTGTIRNSTALNYPWGYDYAWNGTDITDLFGGLEPDVRNGYAFITSCAGIWGVILPNQIYSSPDMFNQSITTIVVPEDLIGFPSPFGPLTPSSASTLRAATSNDTLMGQWRNSILAFNETDRVPVLEYLRPVPRLKPLGSAITSVFVSTFAMVSTF